MELMQAHNQWANRPSDERFLSLDSLFSHAVDTMNHSKALSVSSRSIAFEPTDNRSLVVKGPSNSFAPSHWAFGQACARVGAPADYLRSLPAPMAADCLNYGFQYARDVQDVGLLLHQNGGYPEMRAMTGPNYGRVWDAEVLRQLRDLFGDGVNGQWHIPGEFNKSAPITKDNTTLYRGDRDMFVFLCDGEHDIEIPNRRNGQTGRMQRGFFVWNSEVGHKPLGFGTFGFDYMCCNHIVWGVTGFEEIRIRHTSGAPDRWLEELIPALRAYANGSTAGIRDAIAKAQATRLENVGEFLASRFGPRMVDKLQAAHLLEESRPIETVYDAVNAATAVAKGIPWIGPRVDLEREAGKLLVAV